MASSTQTVGPNLRGKIVKAAGFRISDVETVSTTDYAEVIAGDGVPSGGYGRHSGASLVYVRKDASGVDVVLYLSPDGGTTWNAVESSGLGSDAGLTSLVAADAAAGLIYASAANTYTNLTLAADKGIRATGAGTLATFDLTAAGLALLDDAAAVNQRTTLGLAIGTDVQAYDAGLASLVAADGSAGLPYVTGANTWASATLTAAGLALLDDANAAAQLTTLGVSAAAQTILDDANVGAIRTTLGVGTGDAVTVASLVAAGGVNATGGNCTADNIQANGDLYVGQNIQSNNLVKAVCAGADATGGATTALLSVQLYKMDGSTAISAARQVSLWGGASQGATDGPVPNASLSLGTITAGSVISGTQGIWLIETDATGLFACTATNTDDETVYWSCCTPQGGVSDLTKACLVIGSNVDSSAWSA